VKNPKIGLGYYQHRRRQHISSKRSKPISKL